MEVAEIDLVLHALNVAKIGIGASDVLVSVVMVMVILVSGQVQQREVPLEVVVLGGQVSIIVQVIMVIGVRTQQQPYRSNANCFHVEVNSSVMVKSENVSIRSNFIKWLLDSGCSDHIINHDFAFENCITLKEPVQVKLGDGRILMAIKEGNVRTSVQVYGNFITVNNSDVLYVKGTGSNLLSSGKITEKNKIVFHGNVAKIFNRNNELIAIANKRNRLYCIESLKISNSSGNINWPNPELNITSSNIMSLKEKWHRMLGHTNFEKLKV